MSASMNWRYLGHLQPLSKAKHSLTAIAKKEVCPRDEIADPPGTAVLPIGIHGFAEGLVSFRTLCGVQSSLVRFAPNRAYRLGSATVADTVRHSVFQPCVLLGRVLKLDDQTLLHIIVKGIVNELHRCDGRNGLWCAKDDGRGVCSSDVRHLVQKPVSAAEMQFTHATQSPRARQIAGRVVCGSKVDIVAGSSAWDSATMEKSFLQLVSEVLCEPTVTLVQLLDYRPPHSLYTFASELQPSVRGS